MRRAPLVILGFVLVAAAAAGGGYWFAMSRIGASGPPRRPDRMLGQKDPLLVRPMVPQQRFDKPGKSPFMDMQLVPNTRTTLAARAPSRSNPRVLQNLGVRTAAAATGSVERRVEAVGSVAWNERAVFVVQARSGGLSRSSTRAPRSTPCQGQPLVELLVPDWAAAQAEYLLLQRTGKDAALAEAARNRLQLLGMSEAQIGLLEKTGKPQTRITLYAPINGVIAELGVREGMTVMSGAMLFCLVDLSSVWVNAEVPRRRSRGCVPERRSKRACRASPAR